MYEKIEIINKIADKDTVITRVQSFEYAKEITSATLSTAEYFEACKDYPIVFLKDNQNEWYSSAILGYKEKQNLFIDSNNQWEVGKYVPAYIRRYPFIFVAQPNTTELALGVDAKYKDNSNLSEIGRLFDKDGNNTELLNNVVAFMSQYHNDIKSTSEFIAKLDELKLLEERVATITNTKNEKYNISGCFVINEEKLQHLSKKKKDELCSDNKMALITAHLISLSNVQRLGLR